MSTLILRRNISKTNTENGKHRTIKRKPFKFSLLSVLATCLTIGLLSWSGIGHAQGSIQITGTVRLPI